MPVFSAAHVATYAALLFPERERAPVLQLLDSYGAERHELEPERVRMAVLFLSQGVADRLLEYLQAARTDYRDVLCWAEYDRDDRPIRRQRRVHVGPAGMGQTLVVAGQPLDMGTVAAIEDEGYYVQLRFRAGHAPDERALAGAEARVIQTWIDRELGAARSDGRGKER